MAGCLPDHAGQPSASLDSTEQPGDEAAAPVRVVAPEPLESNDTYPSDLYVERDVWLTPRSTGVIERILVDRGDRVKKGQELLILETDLQRVELQIAEQALRYHEAESARTQELLQENIVSSLEALRDEIERDLAASELELARAKLERCTLRAPFDGIVVERNAVSGQRVIEEEGARLIRLVADDRRRAKLHVPETRLQGLELGGSVEIFLEGSSESHPGRVVFVSPAVDAASGTALVIVESEISGAELKIGSAVEVRLPDGDGARARLFRIPREALVGQRMSEGRQATVYVASAGHAAERRVDLVDLRGLQATVRGQFEAGEWIIVDGGAGLSPGDPIEIAERSP
jgi:RND family efflux transporter MFP subunit